MVACSVMRVAYSVTRVACSVQDSVLIGMPCVIDNDNGGTM